MMPKPDKLTTRFSQFSTPPRKPGSPDEKAILFAALREGDADIALSIIRRYPDSHAWEDRAGNTPLMMTAIHGEGMKDVTKQLLLMGADVNAQNKHGGNALARAAHFGHEKLVTTLLAAGADPAMRDAANKDAADWARMNNHHAIAAALEEAKKPKIRPSQPKTPEP
jgi:ankyrin repeat protein